MNTVQYTLWLAEQINGALFNFWYITAPLALLFAIAIAWLFRHRPMQIGSQLALLVWPVFPLSLLIIGGVFRVNSGTEPSNGTASTTINVLLGLSFLVHAALVARAHGQRLATSAIGAFGLWLSVCVAFVAGMSVTGDWL